MKLLYVLTVIIGTIILGCIVPVVQLLISPKRAKPVYKYTFSDELINHDIKINFRKDYVSREIVATRGWIRGPQGEIMTNDLFEQKKATEYSLDLP